MKKLVVGLVLAVTCMGLGISYADDKGMSETKKDECLLISQGCRDATMSIQQKIDKLNAEIKKGQKVYTTKELKKLKNKLKETDDMLNNLLYGP
ncbi:MAG: hypothetical protein PHH28_13130 [Desulfuromonadaceae bacterium]|nr:hypothetical protein [Desulfuromonadaceae bacterium]